VNTFLQDSALNKAASVATSVLTSPVTQFLQNFASLKYHAPISERPQNGASPLHDRLPSRLPQTLQNKMESADSFNQDGPRNSLVLQNKSSIREFLKDCFKVDLSGVTTFFISFHFSGSFFVPTIFFKLRSYS